MELREMIYRRKSVRSYTGKTVSEEILTKITECAADLKPLYPEIRVRSEIVKRADVKCMMPWTTPQLVAIYSENKQGYLENVGFMFQQLDLYMQSIGLGVCWLGMGRMSRDAVASAQKDDMEFVILLAFGHPKGDIQRKDTGEFKRKSLGEIADRADDRLEPARIAPSSVNSQPWYFIHDDNAIHVYCAKRGIVKMLGDMNRIDIGIALAHMYVANPENFRFFRAEKAAEKKGYAYMGSFTL